VGTSALRDIGDRLARIRGRKTQVEFAGEVGLHKNTLGTYERGEREIGAVALQQLVLLGWNANWLLTGEGPERVDEMADPVRSGAAGVEWSSNTRQMEAMTHAVREVDAALAQQGRRLPPAQKARAYVLLAEVLADDSESLPSAQIVNLALKSAGPVAD
jgi:transcriptional regulator with XRE-family HTH domain